MNTRPSRLREVAYVLLFYFFFSFLYHVVLWINFGYQEHPGPFGWLNLRNYWFASGMQYAFYLLASVFIYLLAVRGLRRRRQWVSVVAVAILIPVVTYFVRAIRYGIVDYFGYGRLRGSGTIWDWYIPCLFLFIQFGCYFAYTYFRENQRKLMVEGELRQAALRSELSAIKAQLNPHFLYNVFNTISASLPPESEGTREMISQLSDLFRYQLRATRSERVPLREELDFVTKYLELERRRFGDRLRIRMEIGEDILDRPVPPMILQPIVENSVRHGLSPLIEGGEITISIFSEGDRLRFRVADTGVGTTDKAAVFDRGIGLTNTRLRLEKGFQTRLELFDNQPSGLIVQFSL